VSLNSFVSQAVQGALRDSARRGWGGNNGPWGGGQDWGQWGQWGQGGDSNDDRSGRGGRGSSRVRGWVEG
jgi:hypothetical protein